MTRIDIQNRYFEWMYDLVCEDRFGDQIAYRKLLMFLHSTEFVYSVPMDGNRADNGLDLRYKFACRHTASYGHSADSIFNAITGPCSVLEMMIALSIKCEEFMDDPSIGDRTTQWFWGMVVNLGLGAMSDDRFDSDKVRHIVNCFLTRKYQPNGEGGLFTVRNTPRDLRQVEIWHQMCWYLDSIN